MEYNEFIRSLESFESNVKGILPEDYEDYTEMIFATDYRRMFFSHNLKTEKNKLSIEVQATIPKRKTDLIEQAYYTEQLQNTIKLCNYLLELQKNSFTIDLLPEEGTMRALFKAAGFSKVEINEMPGLYLASGRWQPPAG